MSDANKISEYAICGSIKIAENSNVRIDPFTVCGNGVKIEQGVQIGSHSVIGENSHSDILENEPATVLAEYSRIGSHVVVESGLHIGRNSRILSGSIVRQNVPAYSIVSGQPAKIIGYVDSKLEMAPAIVRSEDSPNTMQFINVEDLRGNLTAIEFLQDLPFIPKRLFFVYGVGSDKIRGEHAHYECEQILIAVSGSISVSLDNGVDKSIVTLSSRGKGLYIPRLTWSAQYGFSDDAILLVLASEKYDDADYIRRYSEFVNVVKPI